MFKIAVIISSFIGLVVNNPIAIYNNWSPTSEHDAASLGSVSEGLGHGGGCGDLGGHEELQLSSIQGSESGYYGGIAIGHGGGDGGDSGASASHGGGGSSGGDYHHGVSIVGGGSGGKGHQTSFDLTHHGGDGHTGLFGGSFVVSGKHEGGGGDGGAHQGISHHDLAAALAGGGSSGSSHLSHLGLGAYGGSGGLGDEHHQLDLSGGHY